VDRPGCLAEPPESVIQIADRQFSQSNRSEGFKTCRGGTESHEESRGSDTARSEEEIRVSQHRLNQLGQRLRRNEDPSSLVRVSPGRGTQREPTENATCII